MDNALDIKKPTVVADRNIPFLKELLGSQVNLIQLAPELIDADAVRDADVLITRTRTRCNADLLGGSRCSMVATATIGTDHIDFDYCRSHGIKVVSAPGCNAPAVAQYVWSTILRLLDPAKSPSEVTVAVVGVGHVGSIVANWGTSMGYNMLLCDPPRALAEAATHQPYNPAGAPAHQLYNTADPPATHSAEQVCRKVCSFVDMDTVAREADVITFHTPLTRQGEYPTYHLASDEFLSKLQRQPILINSARGPVTDTHAILRALDRKLISHAVIDCWEGEPNINAELLSRATYATPHIAGYSLEGKTRASVTVARAVCDHLGLEYPAGLISEPPAAPTSVTPAAILASYDPAIDTAALRAAPGDFESLRNHYNLRHEV